MNPDLRYQLRERTRKDHDDLDELVSQFDLASHDGFRAFVQLHLCCFLQMQSRLSPECRSGQTLDDMVDGLRADLQSIDAAAIDPVVDVPIKLDPLAIDYMVAGSRLGSKILAKRWATSTEASVQNADAYFGQQSDKLLWPVTCQSLSDVAHDDPRATQIIDDTRFLFQLFAQTFRAMQTQQDALV